MKYNENKVNLSVELRGLGAIWVEFRVPVISGIGRRELHRIAHTQEKHLRATLARWARYVPSAEVLEDFATMWIYYLPDEARWRFYGLESNGYYESKRCSLLCSVRGIDLPSKPPPKLVQWWSREFVTRHQLALFADVASADGGPLQGY